MAEELVRVRTGPTSTLKFLSREEADAYCATHPGCTIEGTRAKAVTQAEAEDKAMRATDAEDKAVEPREAQHKRGRR